MDWNSLLVNTAQALFSPVTVAFAMAALGLAVHFGFVGLLNFGIAGFMAVGAYGYAISSLTFGFPWWAAFLASMVASALFALLMGIPTLQLRGDYLAIVTIAAAEIIRLLLLSTTWIKTTGSADGLVAYADDFRSVNPFPPGAYGFGPWSYTANQFWVLTLSLVMLALCLLFVWRLVKSPWGRVVKGIREDEDAVFGPLLGAVIFWVLQAFLGSLLPALADLGVLGALSSAQAGSLRFVLVGILLIVLVVIRPQGLVGDKRELTFVK